MIDAKRGDHSHKADLPGLNAPGVRFVIGFLHSPMELVLLGTLKTIIAWSVDGRIQNYSREGHHDPKPVLHNEGQRAGRCNSSVNVNFPEAELTELAGV